MIFLKEPCENGGYIDKDSVRWNLLAGEEIWRPKKEKNEGCDEFASYEEALKAYGLEKYVEPTPEPVEVEAPEDEAEA